MQKKKPAKKKADLFINFLVRIPLYNTSVCFVVSEDVSRTAKFVAHWFDGDCGEWGTEVYGRTLYRKGYASVVWFPHFPKTPKDYGAMAHEVGHAAYVILGRAGVTLTEQSEEAFTYLQEYIVEGYLTVRDKRKTRTRSK